MVWYNTYPGNMLIMKYLKDTLCHHGFCNFQEACNICTLNIIDVSIRFGTIFHAIVMNIVHYVVQLLVNLFTTPAQAL